MIGRSGAGRMRDGVWHETGIVEKFADKQLKLDWRAPIGAGYSGPTIADGRVFITDRIVEPTQVERVHCFDSKTGHELWTHKYDCRYSGVGYDAGPRAAVTIDTGRAYALGAMGNLHCLDAATGRVLWKKDLLKQYQIQMPIWGIAAAPLVDGPLLIVQIGGEKACVVAFDKTTGDERWKSLDDRASYSAPIIIEQAGRRVWSVGPATMWPASIRPRAMCCGAIRSNHRRWCSMSPRPWFTTIESFSPHFTTAR